LFSLPVTQVYHDAGELIGRRLFEQLGDLKGCAELDTGWIKGFLPHCWSMKESLDLEASLKRRSTLFVQPPDQPEILVQEE
jgi:hypothetical protein